MQSLNKFGALALIALCVGGVASADSELDGKPVRAPQIVVRELNPTTETVTNYQVSIADPTLAPEALNVLPEEVRKAKIEAFLKAAVQPANKISEEKVVKVEASELDRDGSTGAWRYRWRGYGGGYYGRGYRGYYGRGWVGYRGYWGYGYNGCGYYGGGYGYYARGWAYPAPYYTVYAYDGCGWNEPVYYCN